MMIADLDLDEEIEDYTSVALGNFDGVHIAHQALIAEVKKKSESMNLRPAILLFKEHTKNLINHKRVSVLMTNEQKINVLKNMGIEVFFLKAFDKEFMETSPKDFMEKFLLKKMKAKSIVVGFDYKFGKNALGDVNFLLELEDKISVSVIEEVYEEGVPVSSSNIRELIKSGKMEKANKILTRPYTISGEIVHGKAQGGKMGFPTANLFLSTNYVIPKDGVYKTEISFDKKRYLSATSVGKNPTLEGEMRTIETHIPNFSEDLYGKTVELSFISYEREMIKFSTTDELKEQMERDLAKIKRE